MATSHKLQYDHPFPRGTVLQDTETPNHLKFIVDVEGPLGSGIYNYTTFTTPRASEQPHEQSSMDFEEMATNDDYPDWEVLVRPDD